jgi:hypothetical protein
MRMILILAVLFMGALQPAAQCPRNDSLWKVIRQLRQDGAIDANSKLEKLAALGPLAAQCNDSTYEYYLRSTGACYYSLHDYTNAAVYFNKAIDLMLAHEGKPGINIAQLVDNYYFLSFFYGHANNIAAKMAAINHCISTALRLHHTSSVSFIRALYERVEYSYDIGDYYRCMEDARLCQTYALEYVRHDSASEYGRTARANALSSQAWYVKLQLIQKHYDLLEEYLAGTLKGHQDAGRTDFVAYTWSCMGEVRLGQGNYVSARRYFEQSYQLYRQLRDSFSCKQVLNQLATDIYFRAMKDPGKALEWYNRALSYTSTSDPGREQVESMNIFTGMANVHASMNRYESASYYYQKAFDQLKPGSDETQLLRASAAEVSGIRKIHYLAALVSDKGNAFLRKYRQQGNPADGRKAIETFRAADKLLSIMKTEQVEMDSKLYWRANTRRIYENAIDACFLQANAADAFYFFEKGRAALLNDQLAAQKLLGTETISRQLSLKKEILKLEKQLNNPADELTLSSLRTERHRKKEELDELEALIKTKYPLYYQGMLDTNFITLRDLRPVMLKDHKALVEIFAGDSAVYVLAITPARDYFNKIDKRSFEKLAADYTSIISDPGRLNRQFALFTDVSHRLYRLLFRDIQLPAGRIIISPDGQYFPFESLVTDMRDGWPVYFTEDHAMSYTYSARFLQNIFPSGAAKKDAFLLGVAPVSFPAPLNLPALEGSKASLENIAGNFNAYQSMIGQQASRKNFLDRFRGYPVIQLYTHAAGNSHRNEPVIFFADGPLYLSDLMPEKSPATRLIVLSGCETGQGKIYQGEGLFNFSRGFAAMGIPSSVNNLWTVESATTYELTERFYKYLSDELPADVALQRAKLDFIHGNRKELSFPYYWAATVLVGKTDIITPPRTHNWIAWLTVGIAIITIIILLRKTSTLITLPPNKKGQ